MEQSGIAHHKDVSLHGVMGEKTSSTLSHMLCQGAAKCGKSLAMQTNQEVIHSAPANQCIMRMGNLGGGAEVPAWLKSRYRGKVP
jgi:hypothetical protein